MPRSLQDELLVRRLAAGGTWCPALFPSTTALCFVEFHRSDRTWKDEQLSARAHTSPPQLQVATRPRQCGPGPPKPQERNGMKENTGHAPPHALTLMARRLCSTGVKENTGHAPSHSLTLLARCLCSTGVKENTGHAPLHALTLLARRLCSTASLLSWACIAGVLR